MEKGPIPGAPPSYEESNRPAYPVPMGQPVYPPQPGMPGTATVVGGPQSMVVQQPGTIAVIVPTVPLGSNPATMMCPHCHAQITTTVQYESGLLAWAAAGILCVLGCWLGCCLIPFCLDDCKDTHHYCPNCKALVGRYKRLN